MRDLLLTLTRAPGLGNATIKKMLEKYQTPEAILKTPQAELLAFPRVKEMSLEFLNDTELEQSRQILSDWAESGYQLIFWGESTYPQSLKRLNNPPMFFFYRGQPSSLSLPSIAIVGTREPSQSARASTLQMANEIVQAGYTITSGFAMGVDGAAHQGALEAGGQTAAVLGSGIADPHPKSNHNLLPAIVKSGCLISEFFPTASAQGRTLMSRNRVVVGLSETVIVVEAGARSGSIDAGRRALKLGIPVRVIPGSPGTDQLLREGASCYAGAESLLPSSSDEGPEQLMLI